MSASLIQSYQVAQILMYMYMYMYIALEFLYVPDYFL